MLGSTRLAPLKALKSCSALLSFSQCMLPIAAHLSGPAQTQALRTFGALQLPKGLNSFVLFNLTNRCALGKAALPASCLCACAEG